MLVSLIWMNLIINPVVNVVGYTWWQHNTVLVMMTVMIRIVRWFFISNFHEGTVMYMCEGGWVIPCIDFPRMNGLVTCKGWWTFSIVTLMVVYLVVDPQWVILYSYMTMVLSNVSLDIFLILRRDGVWPMMQVGVLSMLASMYGSGSGDPELRRVRRKWGGVFLDFNCPVFWLIIHIFMYA